MFLVPDKSRRMLPPVVMVGGVVGDDGSNHGVGVARILLVAPRQDVTAKLDLLLAYFGTPEYGGPRGLVQECQLGC